MPWPTRSIEIRIWKGIRGTWRCWNSHPRSLRRTTRLPTEPRRFTGYGVFDALHLACAEAARVDVMLTTDDSFVRKASRGDGRPRVAVRNPLSWSQENS